MGLKFNIDRPKISEEEIEKRKDFEQLVRRFREQSLKKARGDESWRGRKKVQYTAIIAGITVVCTVTLLTLSNQNKQQTRKNETITTQSSSKKASVKRPAVSPPSRRLAQGYTSYTLNAARGASVTHKSGTRITVPSSGFVDKSGRDIIGDVTIEYREFHDHGDIILSGIPMRYDSAGIPFNLESAGMFDIRGYQDGEPVFIRPEKKIEVALASANAEDRFNQYYFDTVANNWRYLRRDKVSLPAQKAATATPQQVPHKLLELERKQQLITAALPKRTDSIGKVYTRKIETLPAAKKPVMPPKATAGRPTFRLEGSYEEFPELAAFDGVLFEVGPENKNYNRELHEITWSDIRVSEGPDKGKNYLLTLQYRNRRENLVVYPVLAEGDYPKARKKYEERLRDYERVSEKRAAEEKRLLAEMEAKQKAYMDEQRRKQDALAQEIARVRREYDAAAASELSANFNTMSQSSRASRIFQVATFGIYNADCPHPRPTAETINPIFIVHGTAKFVRPDRVYLVDHGKKTVYEFAGTEKLKVDKGDNYSMCVFANEKMYFCSRKSYESTRDKSGNHFEVKEVDAENLADFKKALEI